MQCAKKMKLELKVIMKHIVDVGRKVVQNRRETTHLDRPKRK